jgi:CRISP-associated protein Cas1
VRPLLNTLYVSTDGAYIHREGETVAVRVSHETKGRFPLHALRGIVCLGRISCSPQLMEACAERGVLIAFLSETGRFWGRVCGPVSGNVLLRRAQYRWADDPERSARLARAMVLSKGANARSVLLRAMRDHPESPGVAELDGASRHVARALRDVSEGTALDSVRGVEGECARAYFGAFDHLIVAQKEAFHFEGRNRRPPLDRVNALLSFLYSVLTADVVGALESVGLDPCVGFLHRDRPGRPSLALDLMEELRPVVADRLVLSLINRQQVREGDFILGETGEVRMTDEARKTVIVAYQKRKQEEIRHPYLEERVPMGLVPHLQAALLARHLRGDLDGYPAFLWR